ncbi:hypothetical protein CPB83DRAFT_339478 [Crepidotus variabilis]|uniref:Uncharacterized protein n=1 Tax=Crepidotus variabilis TaxID=179855 RepID=A0A9P6ETR0_9AGAR|nr:hypothetical protein CPB83DRAFT_339478 [Crepidotus variabilis]
MPQDYLLLSGERSLLKNHYGSENDLAKILAQSPRLRANEYNAIELIFGLESNGSAHLLLTAQDAFNLPSSVWRGRRANSSDYLTSEEFESLSPIQFPTIDDLANKLRSLQPKKAGKSSKANRAFFAGAQDPYRAAFEHGRMLYGILNNTMDAAKYGIEDTSWTRKIRICSFMFNVKSPDGRPTTEREANPDVLDFGFCESHLPDLSPNTATAMHVVNKKNLMLNRRKRAMQAFRFGESRPKPLGLDIGKDLAFLKDFEEAQSKNPIILLVCKEDITKNFLSKIGIDTSRWKSGIQDLLMPNLGSVSSQRYPKSELSSPGPDWRNQRRDRSRSPGRRTYESSRSSSYTASSSSRYPSAISSRDTSYVTSPTPTTAPDLPVRAHYPPVYTLDIWQLYSKLMQTHLGYDDWILDIGRALGLEMEDRWCAGNEAVLALKIFQSMVSSSSIDQQRAERMASLQRLNIRPGTLELTPVPIPEDAFGGNEVGSDDDEDPNNAPVRSVVEQVAHNHHDEDSDPDGFFNDSDSD